MGSKLSRPSGAAPDAVAPEREAQDPSGAEVPGVGAVVTVAVVEGVTATSRRVPAAARDDERADEDP